jgi:hypothetical protein
MNAANRNARRLVADAKLLLDAGRYPSAAALAALAIEESGKTSILRTLAVVKNPGNSVRNGADIGIIDQRTEHGFCPIWLLAVLVNYAISNKRSNETRNTPRY